MSAAKSSAGSVSTPASNKAKALVTGATSGIGRATALQLARDGYEVIVHGRDASRGAEIVAAIEAEGGKAKFINAELGDVADVKRLAEQAVDVDVLVNNAGFAWFGPTADIEAGLYDSLFDNNVRSAYFLTAVIAPRMVERGRGSIINIGSMAGQIGLAGGAAYSATKAALASLTRSWAAEFSPSGVRVNTVSPGPVETGIKSPIVKALGETTLLKRVAQAEEIAKVISFLVSPAAGYVTGSIIPVDAGRTAI